MCGVIVDWMKLSALMMYVHIFTEYKFQAWKVCCMSFFSCRHVFADDVCYHYHMIWYVCMCMAWWMVLACTIIFRDIDCLSEGRQNNIFVHVVVDELNFFYACCWQTDAESGWDYYDGRFHEMESFAWMSLERANKCNMQPNCHERLRWAEKGYGYGWKRVPLWQRKTNGQGRRLP